MLDIMTQASNAIEVYNAALNIHSANIANMSVTGYKALDVSFQSILEKMMHPGSASTNPQQFGQGVAIGNISIDFSNGTPAASTHNVDLAITGSGLFVVSDDGGVTRQYTRAGSFLLSGGSLVTQNGMQVYGLNASGSLVAITGLTGAVADYSWDDGTGELLKNGTATGYRIALTYFSNANGLQQASGTTFKESVASGSPATSITTGGAAGTIAHGYVEQSNVFYLGESIDSLEMQRALSANLTVVRAASDIISQVINKLG